ncbi:ATPase [Egibacter rhizosphaerae]|uniref:ATPase n=1 Tax=Egibacter rhizosphaerae TaxID=1670831 RepID=A0A411YIM5_9ACTN|nr:ABC-ATPase domain-containing protein [Egibacter rhizosphaerae]QBI20936.1 ATPase [Egibacter rhizosphaerae]
MAAPTTLSALRGHVQELDGKGYGAYKSLRDERAALDEAGLPGAELRVERVQADPFAPPSRLTLHVPASTAKVPGSERANEPRRRAVADHLLRLLDGQVGRDLHVDAGRQEVLERSAVHLDADGNVTVRLGASLPAAGRKIKGRAAAALLTEELPQAATRSLRWEAIDASAAVATADTVEDAVALRAQLAARGLVAFVADGSVLPRASGVDDRPLEGGVPLEAPETLAVELEAPHAGLVRGLGIRDGVTLVVGGGFHGKSTLLRALERGVYDHVPGDGRERVVTRDDAVKIRAEDGRAVTRCDVSAFVGELPTGDDTRDFSTENASGSTSQAAAIVEAIEAGAGSLLIDEDTSATNLMIRDAAMRELVVGDREPLTPFVDLVRSLARDREVATVLVLGGSGDYFGVADTVVHMDAFAPHDVTDRAHAIAEDAPKPGEPAVFPTRRGRVPRSNSLTPPGKPKVSARGVDALRYGEATIDLDAVEQLVDPSQTAAVGRALRWLADDRGGDDRPLAARLDALDAHLAEVGVHGLAGDAPVDLARPRRFEVAAALNRLRSLAVADLR